MDIILSKHGGFCPGVKRADGAVRELIASHKGGGLIFTLGHLIHNEIYIDELRKLGVESIRLDEIPDIIRKHQNEKITFVIRTHGIAKAEREYLDELVAKNDCLSVVDMTCPSVKRIQEIAKTRTSENTHFVLFGSPEHDEVRAVMSYAVGEKTVISSLRDAEELKISDKIPILCSQTTQNLLLFVKIKKIFEKRFTNAQIFDTICSVTENRQNEAVNLARECDMMIVIGSKQSSNTHKLYEICKRECVNTQWLQSLDCPSIALSGNTKKVGITAGASTPDGIILEVYKAMENFSEMLEGSLKTLHTGETVTGTVVTIGKNEINLDLGAKFTGVLTKEQITDDPNAVLSEMFKVGDEVECIIEGIGSIKNKIVK